MRKALLFHFFLFISILGHAQNQYLQLRAIVTDSAQIFTPEQLDSLTSKLNRFESETTNQLVILTINELGYETIEEYANGTFNQNRLGQEDKDNGILILFSKNDREVRIEVGYGLEPYITDAVASRIIRNTMIPKFKEEDYFGGLDLATDQIIEFLLDPEALEEFKRKIEEDSAMPLWAKIVIILFLSVFVFAGGFVFYKGYSALIEMFRGIFIGKLGLVPGIFMIPFGMLQAGFGLVFMLMPLFFLSMFLELNINIDPLLDNLSWLYYVLPGFFVFTMLLALLKIMLKGKEDFKLSWVKSDSNYMSKTFSSSGTHSFGSSSGGSSSSFSGGGGSSGGGGASGSW
jgi:uncharacterized protein